MSIETLQVGDKVRIRQQYWSEFNKLAGPYGFDGMYTLQSQDKGNCFIKETAPRGNTYIVPQEWLGPNNIWMDILEVKDGHIEENGRFNFYRGHPSGGHKPSNPEMFLPFLGKDVHVVYRAGNSGYSGRPFKAEIIKEKLYYKHPDNLEQADGTSVHTVMDLDGTRRWVIVGYTEAGYCSWQVNLEDLDNFLTDFKKEHTFNV